MDDLLSGVTTVRCMGEKYDLDLKLKKDFEEHEDEIRDEIYGRNDSDVLAELIKNTDDIPVRVELSCAVRIPRSLQKL